MTELNIALLAMMGFTILLVVEIPKRIIKKWWGEDVGDYWGPIIALALGPVIAQTWLFLGTTAPEGVNLAAYLAIHGLCAAGEAVAGFTIGKRVLNGK